MAQSPKELEDLPDEVILSIMTYLSPYDVLRLQQTNNRNILRITKDNFSWKVRCYASSLFGSPRVASSQFKPPLAKREILKNWDILTPGRQDIDWVSEFKHRKAPIAAGWLEIPLDRENIPTEVQGVAIQNSFNSPTLAIGPTSDGRICLWNLSSDSSDKGRIMTMSDSGILFDQWRSSQVPRFDQGITESIKLDQRGSKAYVAIKRDLVEIDLQTLQATTRAKFPDRITTMSEPCSRGSITIGIGGSIHIYDPREHRILNSGSLLDPVECILNGDSFGSNGRSIENSIYASGRFSNILTYDRRNFPVVQDTIHTGSRVSALAMVPVPFIGLEEMKMPDGNDLVFQSSAKPRDAYTLIAGGEYGSKGSLELYELGDPVKAYSSSNARYQNRQTAASSKIMSVTDHGTRIVFSDGDGNLKWVERDGSTEVRRWNINNSRGSNEVNASALPTNGREGARVMQRSSHHTSNDFIRKIDKISVNGDLVLWTGEELCMLQFAHSNSSFSATTILDEDKAHSDAEMRSEERAYEEMMRLALERQGAELQFMAGLGLGLH